MLIFSSERRRNLYNLCIGSNSFDVANKFRYLGNVIGSEGCANTTIRDRIQIGNRAYYANSILLRSKLISYNTKMKIYTTLIRSVVAYGGETWTLAKNEQCALRRYERKIVRPG